MSAGVAIIYYRGELSREQVIFLCAGHRLLCVYLCDVVDVQCGEGGEYDYDCADDGGLGECDYDYDEQRDADDARGGYY